MSPSSSPSASPSASPSPEEKVSYLEAINSSLIAAISNMNVNNKYFYTTGTQQQEDLAKVNNYPLYNVYLYPEEISSENRYFTCMNRMRNISRWQIKCYNKNIESSNSQFEIEKILYKNIEDIKRMINVNFTLNGLVEGMYYKRGYINNLGNGSDIVKSKHAIVELEIIYSEDINDLGTYEVMYPNKETTVGLAPVNSYLDNITNKLISNFNSMNISNNYFYTTGTTQQEDFAKVTNWPLYNINVREDIGLNDRTTPSMGAFKNNLLLTIKGYNKILESSNSQFDVYNTLDRMIDDVKKLIYSDYTLGGLVQSVNYKRSYITDSGNKSDIIIPKFVTIEVEIEYNQDVNNTSNQAYV